MVSWLTFTTDLCRVWVVSIAHYWVVFVSYPLLFSTILAHRNSGFTQTMATNACNLALPLIRRTPIDTGWHPILGDLAHVLYFNVKTYAPAYDVKAASIELQRALSSYGYSDLTVRFMGDGA